MRTLIRYAWPATYSIYFGTLVVMLVAFNVPYQLHDVLRTFVVMWFGVCVLWCLAIWVSAALTREGRSSSTPWVSGAAVAIKLIAIIVLFGDNLRRLWSRPVEGRPLRADGETQRTAAKTGHAWSRGADALEPEPDLAHVDWLRLAGDEHASVAAFSRLSLELLAVGAPPELVAGAHRAALEEVQHAQLCFRVASLVTSRPCTAAPLPAAVAPLQTPSLARLAIGSFVDGCLNEGAAARGVERLAAKARTPWLRAALTEVARHELGHADLAARIAAWCTAGGQLEDTSLR